jgi:hypothetical protein
MFDYTTPETLLEFWRREESEQPCLTLSRHGKETIYYPFQDVTRKGDKDYWV